MLRRLLAVSLIAGLGIAAPPREAVADSSTVTIPPAAWTMAGVVDRAGDRFLMGDFTVVTSAGVHVGRFDHSTYPVGEFTGDLLAVSRSPESGVNEVALIGLDGRDVMSKPTESRATVVGREGWVEGQVFHNWDGSEIALPDHFTPEFVRGGRLITGSAKIMTIATGEVRDYKGDWGTVRTDGQRIVFSRGEEICVATMGGVESCRPTPDPRPAYAMYGADVSVGYSTWTPSTEHYSWHSPSGSGEFKVPSGTELRECRSLGVDIVCSLVGPEAVTVVRVTATGDLEPILTPVQQPVAPTRVALGPDRVYGVNDASYGSKNLWLTQGVSTFGPFERMVGSGAPHASAGRALVGRQLFNAGRPTTMVDGAGSAPRQVKLSGPQFISFGRVLDVDGADRTRVPRVTALFGRIQLSDERIDLGSGATVRPSKAGLTFRHVWGRLAIESGGEETIVRDLTTGASTRIAPRYGTPALLGDGVLVTERGFGDPFHVFDLTKLSANLAPVATVHGEALAIERNRVAWKAPDGSTKITTYAFGGKTQPLFLGASGREVSLGVARPWDVQFDLSAPVRAGRVTIRNAAGKVVRTLTTPASTSGSINVVWDARDSGGAPVLRGAYTWRLEVADQQGKEATEVDLKSPIEGRILVGDPIKVTAVQPSLVRLCGATKPTAQPGNQPGYQYTVRWDSEGLYRVTAVANYGYVLAGKSEWLLGEWAEPCAPKPTPYPITWAAPPTFVDNPGTRGDYLIIPEPKYPILSYTLAGETKPPGKYRIGPGLAVVGLLVEAPATTKLEWRHTYSAAGQEDVYSVPGEHLVNGRRWRTECEPYSMTQRCRTTILATQVQEVKGKFVVAQAWAFNNLTYLPSPRKGWKANPLGHTAAWTAIDGRKWRTECDTAVTGKNGCRSYTQARVITSTPKPGGGYTYRWETKWIFNNMVRFS